MTTKGKKETTKTRSYRITSQKSTTKHATFKESTRVKSVKGTRRATRR